MTVSLYKQFGTNKEAEVKGVWVEIGGFEEGDKNPAFKLARMGKSNKKYTKELERAMKPHRKAMQLDLLNENVAEKVMMETFVKTVLLDWRNVKNEKDKTEKFSFDNAIKLFKDLPDLYAVLLEQSSEASLFREIELEGDSKN